jgi:transcriptional regulator with XRE-family HTH domain
MAFAEKLARLRREKGWTQEVMAKQIGVGIAQMRRYERGVSAPTLEVIKNMARTLGISADELIFDKQEGVAATKILDKELLGQFEELLDLPPQEQEAVKTILDGLILKHRMQRVMPPRRDAAWSKEMRALTQEFRQSAANYSGEEIEQIVDEAVEAVRSAQRPRKRKASA